jgi:predicted ATP-dependent endonuclease of OLD family
MSDTVADATSTLADVARAARSSFGDSAGEQLGDTLKQVGEIAVDLGVDLGGEPRALIDIDAVSLSTGAISLHDQAGIPLKKLGTGSGRLLLAGIQKNIKNETSPIVIDEVELGLEPNRVIRLLESIGAKDANSIQQSFITTHSPVVVRELNASQLNILRNSSSGHVMRHVGARGSVQGAIRLFPEALLSKRVVVCEGASEFGFLRGTDRHFQTKSAPSLHARGTALVDGGGERMYDRAKAFLELGFPTAIVRDSDKSPPKDEAEFTDLGGVVFKMAEGRALEDEIFLSLDDPDVNALIEFAIDQNGYDTVNENIKTRSDGLFDLEKARSDLNENARVILGKASRIRKRGWFKSVTLMERVAEDFVAPHFTRTETDFGKRYQEILNWAHGD